MLSAVIAGKNRPERLQGLLQSLLNQETKPTEIIVIDDGSDPPLPRFETATLQLRLEAPVGACRARNLGIAHASGKYILIADDDAELADRLLLSKAVQLAERVPKLGAIAFRQLDSQGMPHWMQPLDGDAIRLAPTFYGYGALLSQQALEQVGYFFEPLQYYFEENELSMRLIDQGFDVVYDPSLEIVHHSESTGRNYRIIHRLGCRNTMFTIVARYPMWLVPLALVLAAARWVMLAVRWKEFRLSDLGWTCGSLVKNLPGLLRDRSPIRLGSLRRIRELRRRALPPELLPQLAQAQPAIY